MKSDLEQMAEADDDDKATITDRIERAVAHALHTFGLINTAETLKRVEEIAERIDKRNEQLIEAEWQSMSARAATLKSKMEKK